MSLLKRIEQGQGGARQRGVVVEGRGMGGAALAPGMAQAATLAHVLGDAGEGALCRGQPLGRSEHRRGARPPRAHRARSGSSGHPWGERLS